MATATPVTVKVVCPLCFDPIQVRLVPVTGRLGIDNGLRSITLKIEETGEFSDHITQHINELSTTQDTERGSNERDE